MKVMMGFLWDLTKAPLVVELAPSGLLSITSTAIYLIKIYFKGRRPKFYDNSFATPIYLVTRKIRPYYLKRALIIGTCLFNKSLSSRQSLLRFISPSVHWTSMLIELPWKFLVKCKLALLPSFVKQKNFSLKPWLQFCPPSKMLSHLIKISNISTANIRMVLSLLCASKGQYIFLRSFEKKQQKCAQKSRLSTLRR